MRFRVLLPGLLALLLAAGCNGPKPVSLGGPAAVSHDLTTKEGRWFSERKLIQTEWTFHANGTYDALHQEGEVAAQVRGNYHWDGGNLVIEPKSVEARSRDAVKANEVQDRIEKGYVLTTAWDGEDNFTGTPTDGGEPLKFRHQK